MATLDAALRSTIVRHDQPKLDYDHAIAHLSADRGLSCNDASEEDKCVERIYQKPRALSNGMHSDQACTRRDPGRGDTPSHRQTHEKAFG
jgi:hypothetical protein